MADRESALNYLRDLGRLIREAAVAAQEQRERQRAGGSRDAFELGRATAYYEVASLMAQQATAFGLEPAALAFGGFDPDRDLLGAGR